MQTQRRLEDAERRTMAIEMAIAELSDQIGQIKDTLKNLGSGGLGPGSTGNSLFPGVTDGGGGGYYTGDGGWDWGDGTNYAPRGGLIDANSVWDQSVPMPDGAPCRLYVYVYDSATSTPIEGATVKVTISLGSTTRTTNASGYCSFDIAKGISATIDVSASGYDSATRSITVSPGANGIHQEDFHLTAMAPPDPGDSCTLDVLVKDNSGNPINDAPVKIIEAGVETVHNTDSTGHVSFGVTQGESLTIDVYPTSYNSQTRSITVDAGSDGIDHETFTLDDVGEATSLTVNVHDYNNVVMDFDTAYSVPGLTHDNTYDISLSNGSSYTLSHGTNIESYTFTVHVGETITIRGKACDYYLPNAPTGWRIDHYDAVTDSVSIVAGTSVTLHPNKSSTTFV